MEYSKILFDELRLLKVLIYKLSNQFRNFTILRLLKLLKKKLIILLIKKDYSILNECNELSKLAILNCQKQINAINLIQTNSIIYPLIWLDN